MRMFARVFLAINGLIFVVLGLRGIWDPVAHLAVVELTLNTPTALAEARAMYGGASITMGLLFAFGAFSRAWLKPGLTVLAVFLGGLAAGRLAGVMADGANTPIILQFLGIEVVATAVALWLRRKVRDDTF